MIRRPDSIKAEATFRARLAELGATLLEPIWRGNGTPHRVRCSAGHDCTPRLAAHRSRGYRTVTRLLTDLPTDAAVGLERAAIATLALAGIKPVHGREWFDIGALDVVLDITDNWNGGIDHANAGTAA
jgi:hypothetical protein